MASTGGLVEFAQFWSARSEARKIWFSLYTPQEGEESEERLRPEDRAAALAELAPTRGFGVNQLVAFPGAATWQSSLRSRAVAPMVGHC